MYEQVVSDTLIRIDGHLFRQSQVAAIIPIDRGRGAKEKAGRLFLVSGAIIDLEPEVYRDLVTTLMK